MKLQVTASEAHQGKALEIDYDQETITLLSAKGDQVGTVTWSSIIDYIESADVQDGSRHVRAHPRAPLAVKVRYATQDGKQFESITGGIGGGGLFIESGAPLPVGSEMTVEFALPDRPLERLKAKARVAWVRKKPERYLLFPGMGVQFTDIPPQDRQHVMDLIAALNRSRLVR
ncbi:MAG TPA: PilZ domain-containing protein [Nitrospiraceae bacterium]|nr:PilZ domain-containing protein [Nitrospiraceae bacterium]